MVEFSGDAELWKLSPTPGLQGPDGEIIRNDLLLIYLEAHEEARTQFERELAAVQDILELQSNRILAFRMTLSSRIWQMHYDRLSGVLDAFGERLPAPRSYHVNLA